MKEFILHDRRTGEVIFDGTEANRSQPCWVCQHKHKNPSWCLVDATRRVCICQRVSSDRRIGDAGYWHGDSTSEWVRTAEPYLVKQTKQAGSVNIDWQSVWDRMVQAMTAELAADLAYQLKLPIEYISQIEIGWCHTSKAWAFLMRDEQGLMCGIKLRLLNGKKICVKGSRLGLVYGSTFDSSKRDLFVTEGESDCMVASGLGFNAVARPSCSSCRDHIYKLALRKNVVVCADNDPAGKAGAAELVKAICKAVESVITIKPATKDLRSWYLSGITKDEMHWLVKSIRGF